LPKLSIPGIHNRQNAACAAAAARTAGIDEVSIRRALAEFTGLEHRIQWVAEVNGRHFYDDSKSTSPAATIAAVEAMDRPTWLLLGGVSKGTDFGELATQAAKRACGVGVFGVSRRELAAAFRGQATEVPLTNTETLDEALAWCCARSQPGEAILLSPACASFDQYTDFAARGRHFRALVQSIGQVERACSVPTSLL
jgi:UDP-N-acetylmuramoylalanine--D-glutamate ligase